MSRQEWFKQLSSNGKIKHQINGTIIYSDLRLKIIDKINRNESVSEVIEWLTKILKEEFIKQVGMLPKDGAVNNVLGHWNELIIMTQLCEIALELGKRKKLCIVIFSLPPSRATTFNRSNNAGFQSAINTPKFLSLFNEDAISSIQDCISNIFFSSPDCIVAVVEDVAMQNEARKLMQQQLEEPNTSELFDYLKQKLSFSEVKSVISLKTSNRPDRRYQPSFEAAMIKALAKRTNQPWKYYMVTNENDEADSLLFNQLGAPHSIADGIPEKLVDDFFVYQCRSDLMQLMEAAVS
jgi:hypothetical protein